MAAGYCMDMDAELFPSDRGGDWRGTNLLPRDGRVFYLAGLLAGASAAESFEALRGADFWRNDEVVMFGKRLVLSRKMAWFGEVPYKYAGALKEPLPWDGEVLRLKSRVEEVCGCVFNSCLLNLYADGSEGMGWHSDDESSLVGGGAIASVSLGAERFFRFKHRRTGGQVEVWLQDGSLLLMEGETQSHWVHALPKSRRVRASRVNLTFRMMKDR
jgi:alkylated DNA repair dioxygenase AlkB